VQRRSGHRRANGARRVERDFFDGLGGDIDVNSAAGKSSNRVAVFATVTCSKTNRSPPRRGNVLE
jgi:hypothetical protein